MEVSYTWSDSSFGVKKWWSMDWLIQCLIKAGARVSYHAWRWYGYVASASSWGTIIGRCWAGAFKIHCIEVSGF
jgi:hypothetical protein